MTHIKILKGTKNLMKITVNINKPLRSFFDDRSDVILDASDYFDIYSGLKNMFPKFNKLLNSIKNTESKFQDVVFIQDNKIIDVSKFKLIIKENLEVSLTPVFFGAAPSYTFSNLYSDIKSSFMYPLFGLSTASTESSDFEGLDKRILDSSLFGRAEEVYAAGMRTENDVFGDLQINTNAKLPIGLHYGLVRVSGTLINNYTKTYRCDPDVFRVKDVIP